MASWGEAIARNLSNRLDERRRFLAEQTATAQENLRRIEASRRQSVGRARENLTRSTDTLIAKGFSEAEVSQLLENDPREILRLAQVVDDVRVEDIRSAARFREDYTPETPLSELIKQATPIFQDLDEPEPAAREQNVFRSLFNMFTLDTEADMDRFYRETNFGGFSGYDILGSVEAGDYRARTSEGPLVDFAALPEPVSATQLNEYRNGAEAVLDDVAQQISNSIFDLIEDPDVAGRVGRQFREAAGNPRAITRLLFDESDPLITTALRPYREDVLSELSPIFDEAPQVFTPTTFGQLGVNLADYANIRDEEEAAPGATGDGEIETTVLPTPITFETKPQTPEELQEALDSLEDYGLPYVFITDTDGTVVQMSVDDDLREWLRSDTEGGEQASDNPEDYEDGSYVVRDGRVMQVVLRNTSGRGRRLRKEFEEIGDYTEEQVSSISELNAEDYEVGQYIKVGNTIFVVGTSTAGTYRRTPMSERPKVFMEVGELS